MTTPLKNTPFLLLGHPRLTQREIVSPVLEFVLQNILPINVAVTFKLSSQKLIQDLTANLTSLESSGWLDRQDVTLYEAIVAVLRIRDVPDQYKIQGIQLSSATQASLYKAIRVSKPQLERIKTTVMLDMTCFAVQVLNGTTPSDADIWLSIRDKDITNTFRDFPSTRDISAGPTGEIFPATNSVKNIVACCGRPGNISNTTGSRLQYEPLVIQIVPVVHV
ncbi:hypothetical protein DFH08DRAFT_824696 [Mycena albidolilacea]|uniref:Uncharacterized protein n=1 Tax=Mycena albidolilacea TaxID=1033008 RepID=A0AAD7E9Y1_9AGAR|nr:hypothetical protein DFH08DRAFT_824696 [Mycena albidolilacea]